jgi:hypothetical protein
MIDLNNPEMIGPYDPVANWKRALIRYMARRFNLPTFIETGTSKGDTIAAVSDYFSDVWSIELSSKLYQEAKERFRNNPEVHLIYGSSDEMLPVIIKQTKGPRLFWLDAHATGDYPGNGDQVNSELNSIQVCSDSLVLIDDVKPGPEGFTSPDAVINIPNGAWTWDFRHGVLILHDGRYDIPEVL